MELSNIDRHLSTKPAKRSLADALPAPMGDAFRATLGQLVHSTEVVIA